MTAETESESDEASHGGDWVVRRLFNDSDEEFSAESLLLGIGGIFALAFFLCIVEPIAVRLIGPVPSVGGSLWAKCASMLPHFAAATAVCVSMIATLLVAGKIAWNLLIVALNCIPAILYSATLKISLENRWPFYHADLYSTNIAKAIIMSAVIGALLIAILFKATLRREMRLRQFIVLACCFPGLLLVGLPIELYRAFPDDYGYHSRRFIYVALEFLGSLIGSAVVSIPFRLATRRSFKSIKLQPEGPHRISIYFLMELTFCVAVMCALLNTLSRMLPNVVSTVVLGALSGLVYGAFVLLWLNGFYAATSVSRKLRWRFVFTVAFLAIVVELAFRCYSPGAPMRSLVLPVVVIALCAACLQSGIVYLAAWWLRGCGWRLVSTSSTVHS